MTQIPVRVKPSREWTVKAPMPADPTECRWCHGRLRALVEGDEPTYCQAGCAKNSAAPYVGHCHECRRQFETGKPGAVLCHGCEQDEAREHSAAVPEKSHYHYSTRYGGRGFQW